MVKNKERFALAIILLALNLRAPFLAVTPLMDLIGTELQLDNGALGWLTTIPLLVFSGLSSFMGVWGNRYGVGKVIWWALILLMAGEIVRYQGSVVALYLGTVFIAIGTAAGNVLLPSIIKAVFPKQIGLMTSLYSSIMGIVTALAIALAVPLALLWGWQEALVSLSIFIVGAMICWWPYRQLAFDEVQVKGESTVSVATIFRQPLAWYIAVYMGIQSFMFFSFTTWLPTILMVRGLSTDMAGYLASIFQTMSLVASFIIPLLVTRVADQRYYAVGCVSFYTIGTMGLYVSSQFLPLLISVAFLGIGAGSTFGVALVYFGVRAKTPRAAAILSGVGQSIGYILASIGPVFLGYLYDYTGEWSTGLIILGLASLLFMWLGYQSGKDRSIT